MPSLEIISIGLVLLASLLLVLSELIKAFGFDFIHAFRIGWTWVLVALNVISAEVVYGILRLTNIDFGKKWFLTALIVGFTYPALLRSRFVYFREVGTKGDEKLKTVALKFDELYTQLQDYCVQAVHTHLTMRNLRKSRVIAKITPPEEMETEIKHFIAFVKHNDLRVKFQNRLDEALKIKPEEDLRKFKLAEMFIEIKEGNPDRFLRKR